MSKVRGRRGNEKKVAKLEKSEPVPETREENAQASTFFGLIGSEELEYFKQAESKLNLDVFDNEEDKANFVESVFEESKGKELKLVTNQICSKLVERLILISNQTQLKDIFKSFEGHFVSLSNHKYSSHCLETLFIRSAAVIEEELAYDAGSIPSDEEFITMENLFLLMVGELDTDMKNMIKGQYSSHVLRIVLLILSGRELPSSISNDSSLRSKKSKKARKLIEIKDNDDFNKQYSIPDSFKTELRKILSEIYKRQDKESLKSLCIDKIASPVIQLIIQIEGIVDRERSFWGMVFSTSEEKDQKEESFLEYLLSDTIGSHFLESCVKYGRLKSVERMYQLYMKDRMSKLANRDNTGAYVIRALLPRLKQKNVFEILDILIPELGSLITKNLDLIETIIETSTKNGDYKKDEIMEKLIYFYSPNENVSVFIEQALHLSGVDFKGYPLAEDRKRSIFLERLISYDAKFLELTINGLLMITSEKFFQMCNHEIYSHLIESILVPETNVILKRKLLNIFIGHVKPLAVNSYGSHISDKLWDFTNNLAVYKERIASEFMANQEEIKESKYGKMVWKNWSMELYIRKRNDWKRLAKPEIPIEKPIDLKAKEFMNKKNVPDNEDTPRRFVPEDRKRHFENNSQDNQKKRSRGRR